VRQQGRDSASLLHSVSAHADERLTQDTRLLISSSSQMSLRRSLKATPEMDSVAFA